MFQWCERRQRRYAKKSQGWRAPEWQSAACKVHSFLSRDTCRGCNSQKDEVHDEYINESAQTAAWLQQSGGLHGASARLESKTMGAAQALALAGQQLTQAKASAMLDECIRILESKVQQEETAMKQAPPLVQKMDQKHEPDFVEPLKGERKRWTQCRRHGRLSNKRNRRWCRSKTLDKLMQEAPLPVVSVPQVNVRVVTTLEALTGIIENMWNPGAGQPPDHLIQAIQESEALLQTCSVILAQEGGAALETEQVADLSDMDEDEAEQVADFEETHAPGGPRAERTRARKAAVERTPMTPPPKKTRTTEPWATEQGDAQASQVQRFSARVSRIPGTRNSCGTLTSSTRSDPCLCKVLRFWAWVWPACCDRACGFPGEGPLTSLDGPDVPDTCITRTQEFRTCAVVRRERKEYMVGDERCASCESSLRPRQLCLKCSNATRCGCARQLVPELLRICTLAT